MSGPESRTPLKDQTLSLLDPRLFPDKESVVEFLRSPAYAAFLSVVGAVLSDDCDSYISASLRGHARAAACCAHDDLAILVADAVGSELLVFNRSDDHAALFSADRIECLSLLVTIALCGGLAFAKELDEFVSMHNRSLRAVPLLPVPLTYDDDGRLVELSAE